MLASVVFGTKLQNEHERKRGSLFFFILEALFGICAQRAEGMM